ncbi:hypothetical protein IG631_07941 [Alternaria alternata]|nr:hypothetical protein IG631_07941 [Alternaria alternata]
MASTPYPKTLVLRKCSYRLGIDKSDTSQEAARRLPGELASKCPHESINPE